MGFGGSPKTLKNEVLRRPQFFELSCSNLARLWGAVGEIPRSPLRFIKILVFEFLDFSSLKLFRFDVLVKFEIYFCIPL